MDEKEVRRVVKDYSDMMIDKNEDGYIAGPMLQQKKWFDVYLILLGLEITEERSVPAASAFLWAEILYQIHPHLHHSHNSPVESDILR